MNKHKRDKQGRAIKKDGTVYKTYRNYVISSSDERKAKSAHLEVMQEYADEVV